MSLIEIVAWLVLIGLLLIWGTIISSIVITLAQALWEEIKWRWL